MAQTNFTPISLYYSATAAAVPTAGNLVAGELAINTADGKLFYKDSAGAVQVIGTKGGVGSSTTTQVLYNSSGLVVGSANLTFDGTTLTAAGLSDSGNLTFTGTGNRIRGDFSNATLTSCVAFQSSTTNGVTLIQAIPNGTGVSSQHRIYNNSDVNNSAFGQFFINASEVRLMSATVGTGTALPLVLSTNNTERLRIDTSGNVGIGTSSPGAKLDVNGGRSFFAANSEAYSLYLRYNGSTAGFFIGSPSADTLSFSTSNGSEKMRIDSSGNVLVGTTSNPLTAKFNVSQSAATWAMGIQNTANNSGLAITNGSGTASYSAVGFYNNGTSFSFCGGITVSGTTTAYNTSSDYRLKENIAPMTGALATVSQLKPVTYNWKVDGSSGQGFIAHELQEFVPDAVCGNKDDVNEDGSIKPQGIDTSFLVATLTAAIQEQQALIENLTTRLNALEGN